ncbi:hypothetical protein [Sphaerisporangium sp. NPDC051011]|uniref:hypothetical protein n=1 Tax=Sphaerisporangium sp. NPDC051011 TaxID=3155792 RepID=UPI0033F9D2DC
MTELPPWCCVPVELTAEEVAFLDGLPDGAHTVESVRPCEIQEGHEGVHMSLGQAAKDDVEWWILWDDAGGREIGVLPPCEIEDPESEHQCVLPLGHPGRCGFALD